MLRATESAPGSSPLSSSAARSRYFPGQVSEPPMGKGYQVVLDDLQDMARTMSTEGSALAGLRPRMAPSPVSGGDPAVDAGIRAALALLASLNAAISSAMAE